MIRIGKIYCVTHAISSNNHENCVSLLSQKTLHMATILRFELSNYCVIDTKRDPYPITEDYRILLVMCDSFERVQGFRYVP